MLLYYFTLFLLWTFILTSFKIFKNEENNISKENGIAANSMTQRSQKSNVKGLSWENHHKMSLLWQSLSVQRGPLFKSLLPPFKKISFRFSPQAF